MLKRCWSCKQVKSEKEFYLDRRQGKTRRQSKCKICSQHRYETKREKVYRIISNGKLECICGCGCTDIRFLEINHKNGGGRKETRGHKLYNRILRGERSTKDLELSCAPYNTIHRLMLKYKLKMPPFKVSIT